MHYVKYLRNCFTHMHEGKYVAHKFFLHILKFMECNLIYILYKTKCVENVNIGNYNLYNSMKVTYIIR